MSEKKHKWRMRRRKAKGHGDIWYLGPISYRGFKILGWVCVLLSAAVAILALMAKANPKMEMDLHTVQQILTYAGALAAPLLLISGFSRILLDRGEYKQMLLTYGGMAAIVIAVYELIYQNTMLRVIDKLFLEPKMAIPIIEKYIEGFGERGFIDFNVFIDIFLCFLIFFFVTVQPKRVFTGKRVYILRACTILPVGWAVTCVCMKYQAVKGELVVPFSSFPFLTTQPITVYILVLFLAVWALKKNFFRDQDAGDALTSLQPRRKSLRFGVILAIALAATALLDFLLQQGAARLILHSPSNVAEAESLAWRLRAAKNIGFGGEFLALLIAAPVMLLFSFNRVPKWRIVSLLAPALAIVLLLLLWRGSVPGDTGIYIVDKIPKISIVRINQAMDSVQKNYGAAFSLISKGGK